MVSFERDVLFDPWRGKLNQFQIEDPDTKVQTGGRPVPCHESCQERVSSRMAAG